MNNTESVPISRPRDQNPDQEQLYKGLKRPLALAYEALTNRFFAQE